MWKIRGSTDEMARDFLHEMCGFARWFWRRDAKSLCFLKFCVKVELQNALYRAVSALRGPSQNLSYIVLCHTLDFCDSAFGALFIHVPIAVAAAWVENAVVHGHYLPKILTTVPAAWANPNRTSPCKILSFWPDPTTVAYRT